MYRKGKYWDNAVAGSFFQTLKMERDIFEFIEIWHNRKRRHSALDYKTIKKLWNQKNNFKILLNL